MKQRQGTLPFVRWGGARDGAGRPKKPGAKLRHAPRAPVAARHPAHVTLSVLPGAPNLRRASAYAAIEAALRATRAREDFRVVHFSVQPNHLHLLVEARGAAALSRGMQGLAIRIARCVNRVARRRGKLWADRFHARVLRSPREVRLALCYVLQNTRRHATTDRTIVDPAWIDPCSSGRWFDGWSRRRGEPADGTAHLDLGRVPLETGSEASGRGRRSATAAASTRVAGRPEAEEADRSAAPMSPAQTWLLSTGWRRCGLIAVDEVPPAAFA